MGAGTPSEPIGGRETRSMDCGKIGRYVRKIYMERVKRVKSRLKQGLIKRNGGILYIC
jgi:hypothetical protein